VCLPLRLHSVSVCRTRTISGDELDIAAKDAAERGIG